MSDKESGKEILFAIALTVPTAFVDGWAVFELWKWFIHPLGAPAIGIWHACGLFTLGRFVCRPTKIEGKGWAVMLAGAICAAVVVGIGFLVHLAAS